MGAVSDDLGEQIGPGLVRQRWFAGKGRSDGDPDHRYQTPLVVAEPHLPAGARALLQPIAGDQAAPGIAGHAVREVERLAGPARPPVA
jgi:hypothetical protein